VKRLRKLQEDGLLTEVAVPGKHIYTYALQGKQQPTRLPYLKRHNVEFRRGEALACNAGLGAEHPGKD